MVPFGWVLCLLAAFGWVTPAEAASRQASATAVVAKAGKPVAASPKRAGAAVAAKQRQVRQVARSAPRAAASRQRVAPVAAARGHRARALAPRRLAQRVEPVVPSVGAQAGLHAQQDPLDLRSGVALVVDQDSNQVLFSKNPQAILPIASITKLMTALVVVESGLPMDEVLSIDQADVEHTSGSRSRLAVGTRLPRSELLQLALMSSENRAAAALARHFPGGMSAFADAMNRKAAQLGMRDTRFVESTGLSSDNRSSALDLASLVKASSSHAVIREFSTARESLIPVGEASKVVHFKSTNGLIGNPDWDISLQKTGYIAAAGRCLVMQAQLAGRRLIMVLLDSSGARSRIGDAERIRQWLAEGRAPLVPTAAVPPDLTTR